MTEHEAGRPDRVATEQREVPGRAGGGDEIVRGERIPQRQVSEVGQPDAHEGGKVWVGRRAGHLVGIPVGGAGAGVGIEARVLDGARTTTSRRSWRRRAAPASIGQRKPSPPSRRGNDLGRRRLRGDRRVMALIAPPEALRLRRQRRGGSPIGLDQRHLGAVAIGEHRHRRRQRRGVAGPHGDRLRHRVAVDRPPAVDLHRGMSVPLLVHRLTSSRSREDSTPSVGLGFAGTPRGPRNFPARRWPVRHFASYGSLERAGETNLPAKIRLAHPRYDAVRCGSKMGAALVR